MKDHPLLPYALHPDTCEQLSVEAYRKAFGHLSSASQPPALCPICGECVELVRAHDRAQTLHFSHPSRLAEPCPLVSALVPDTLAQTSIPRDPARELKARGLFLDKWVWHFQRVRELAPAYSIERFTRGIAHADVLHIWACEALEQSDIPYLFLALAGSMIASAETPRIWFRFWFDSSVQAVSDLHGPRDMPARLYRLRYRNVQPGRFPETRHLTDWTEIPMTSEFLNGDAPRIMSGEKQTFQAFLNRRSGSDRDEAFELEA
ncbi:conserved protein of unknown function [Pararobbsia alpina]|uniref:hypothetical protein n=1 Tax=Pararobbsia alpina TaxID=621374 RepID=UPI0039A49DCA